MSFWGDPTQGEHNPQNPDAAPNFDEWGPDPYWEISHWIEHHAVLVDTYGQPEGNDEFVRKWNSRPGFLANLGDVRGDWIVFNAPFREYLDAYNVSDGRTMLQAIETTSSNPLGRLLGNTADTVENTGDGIGALGEGIENTFKTAKWLLPAALIALVILFGFIIYSKSQIIKIK